MPAQKRPQCFVCQLQASKYACACRAEYCSVGCYKRHQETCSSGSAGTNVVSANAQALSEPEHTSDHPPEPLQEPTPLQPLTTLRWPYVPDTSAYPDPLTRDDPKPLRLRQYEAIATSPKIRTLLSSNPRLRDLLTSINTLRGAEREEALQRALGVDTRFLKNDDADRPLDDDTRVLREFAEAVESAVRGGHEDVLGLDWDRV